jgi:hypothetical protein
MRAFVRDFTPMLERGATTTWEAWNAENHDSLNHAWSAVLPYLVRRGVMGLRPVTAGYGRVELAPRFEVFDTFRKTRRRGREGFRFWFFGCLASSFGSSFGSSFCPPLHSLLVLVLEESVVPWRRKRLGVGCWEIQRKKSGFRLSPAVS